MKKNQTHVTDKKTSRNDGTTCVGIYNMDKQVDINSKLLFSHQLINVLVLSSARSRQQSYWRPPYVVVVSRPPQKHFFSGKVPSKFCAKVAIHQISGQFLLFLKILNCNDLSYLFYFFVFFNPTRATNSFFYSCEVLPTPKVVIHFY